MSFKQSPSGSSNGDYGEDTYLRDGSPEDQRIQTINQNSGGNAPSNHSSPPAAGPLQKRRRVTRACDECRRKKIKCDGKQPCTHCTVYSYGELLHRPCKVRIAESWLIPELECSYDQPSNRRRNPAPQYIEALEIKLRRAENVLRTVLPEVNLDDPALDVGAPSRPPPYVKQEAQPELLAHQKPIGQHPEIQPRTNGERDPMLESMVENTGTLDLDDDGYWDFHGHSSGRAFLRKMREQFGDLMGKPDDYGMPYMKIETAPQSKASPESSLHSPVVSKLPTTQDLPAKGDARLLCENAIDDACAILRFVHQPTFYTMFDRIYDIPPENFSSEDLKFLPLLHSAIALGALFATAEQSQLMTSGFANAIEQG